MQNSNVISGKFKVVRICAGGNRTHKMGH